jgi:hypothetical protein
MDDGFEVVSKRVEVEGGVFSDASGIAFSKEETDTIEIEGGGSKAEGAFEDGTFDIFTLELFEAAG